MFLLSFDDTVIRLLSRIEEHLDFAREEAKELEVMLTPRLQKLAKEDPEVIRARFRAVGSLARAINNLKQQTATVLEPEDNRRTSKKSEGAEASPLRAPSFSTPANEE